MKAAPFMQNCQQVVSPTCETAACLLSRQREMALPVATGFFLAVHLLLCRPCRRYKKHLSILSAASAGYSEQIENLSARQLSPEARQRMKAELEDLAKRSRE